MSDPSTPFQAANFSPDKTKFLIIMVDQQRYPVVYESPELTSWRKTYLKAYETLRANGLEFETIMPEAQPAPKPATLYTGQYPSLHGVSQTNGVAIGLDPDMFWLDPIPSLAIETISGLPGIGLIERQWHASNGDITVPGTHNGFLFYNPLMVNQ